VENKKYKYLFNFCKKDLLVFISHLDLMRLFVRTFQRSGLPVLYSQGFNPHMKISLPFPLSIGITGEMEWGEVYLTQKINELEMIEKINDVLPADIQIKKMFCDESRSSLANSLDHMEYRLIFKEAKKAQQIYDLLQTDIIINKTNKKGRESKQAVKDYLADTAVNKKEIILKIKKVNDGNLRIDDLLNALEVDTDELADMIRKKVVC